MAAQFYENGLRFTCTRCSACCRYDSGYVFLSPVDLKRIAAVLAIPASEVVARYCTNVYGSAGRRISLAEQKNKDCIMWDSGGCSIYDARPMQCRSFPFWPVVLESREAWTDAGRSCPGIDTGRHYTKQEIEQWLRRHRANREQERTGCG